jgi:cytochrome bd ubiquinol oxidase subunit II
VAALLRGALPARRGAEAGFAPCAVKSAECRPFGNWALAERLRTHTLGVGVLAGFIVFAGLGPILLYRRSYSVARVSAVAAVVSVIAGWGVGQYPWMLVDQFTIADGAGAGAILAALLIVVTLAVVIVLPALGYLLRLTQRESGAEPREQAAKPHGDAPCP